MVVPAACTIMSDGAAAYPSTTSVVGVCAAGAAPTRFHDLCARNRCHRVAAAERLRAEEAVSKQGAVSALMGVHEARSAVEVVHERRRRRIAHADLHRRMVLYGCQVCQCVRGAGFAVSVCEGRGSLSCHTAVMRAQSHGLIRKPVTDTTRSVAEAAERYTTFEL